MSDKNKNTSRAPVGGIVGIGVVAVMALAAPLIARWEGVEYKPYVDPVGVLTVCYGHTGPDIIKNKSYTKAECAALLDKDMLIANGYVRRCVARPIPMHVEAALTSLIFNLGPSPVCAEGRTVRRLARAGQWSRVCVAMEAYKYAGGRVFRGLVLRRADERKMCETGM